MSGHSKWSTIKHQKETADKRRGQAFSKLSKAIAVAARSGADPSSNFKLRLAVEKAKQANVPKDNITRAIKKGSGQLGGGSLDEVTYEGYGPAKIAVIVEVVTDNKNRTVAEIKNIFERDGGSLVRSGAVTYQFERVGLIRVRQNKNPEEMMLQIIDLGAEDVEEANGSIEVFTKPGKLEDVAKRLEEAKFVVEEKELFMRPKSLVTITAQSEKEKILKFMENLESHDDVQKVFANFDLVE